MGRCGLWTRWIVLLCVSGASIGVGVAQQSSSDEVSRPAAGELPQIAFPERAAVYQYCVACHNKREFRLCSG